MAGIAPVASLPVGTSPSGGVSIPDYPRNQYDWPNPQPPRRRNEIIGFVRPTPLTLFGAASPSQSLAKLLGYAVLAPPDAVSLGKLLGYAVLAPPDAVSLGKLLGYAVLQPIPFFRFDPNWPNPQLPRRLNVQGEVWASNPSTVVPAPAPPLTPSLDLPVPRVGRTTPDVTGPNLVLVSPAAPFFFASTDLPQWPRRVQLESVQGHNPTILGTNTAPAHLSWMGLEALSPGVAPAQVTWLGVEALSPGVAPAQLSWMGLEVLRDVPSRVRPVLFTVY